MSHNAVSSEEFKRGHFKQRRVEQKLSGGGSLRGLRLQALLNELLKEQAGKGKGPGE